MSTHPNHRILFEPVKIGPVTARNRFYQVPHGPGAGDLPDVDKGIRGARAEGGWGVVCAEITAIHPSSDYNYQSIRRLWSDDHIKDQAITVDEIHKHGALAGVELCHYGMAANNYGTKEPVWGPSAGPVLDQMHIFPHQAREIDKQGIKDLLRWQRDAALRARQAGYDIIYVYAAHNLSIAQHFLSPVYNRRTDEYGGSLENRARLLREMIEVTKDAVGDTCAVAVRMSVAELHGLDTVSTDNEGRQVVELLAELPDLWDVNLMDLTNDPRTSRFSKEGFQEEYVSFVKKTTTKPVVGVGRFTSPDAMASQIRRGVLDMIGAARPSIADPFLPRKIEEGRSDDIRECIGCNHCIKTSFSHHVTSCTQNPTMGEEWRLGWHPETIAPKVSDTNVLVVGAGPAGLEATRALAQRGYAVTLVEGADELGGRVRNEAALPGLAEWARVADWRTSRLLVDPNVTIVKGNPLSAEDILAGLDHDHVVIATGSKWRRDGAGQTNRLPLAIDEGAPIYTPDDIMAGTLPPLDPDRPILVFDDDHYYMGNVMAELLARRGHAVRMVTPAAVIALCSEGALDTWHVIERLRNLGVKMGVHQNLTHVGQSTASTIDHISGASETFAIGGVVLVTQRIASDSLYRQLMAEPDRLAAAGVKSVSLIGDASSPDTIANAVFEGHRYAREFEGEKIDVLRRPTSVRVRY